MDTDDVINEWVCNDHTPALHFDSEKGFNIHNAKMHSGQTTVKIETETEEDTDFDLDSILDKIKISGVFELVFTILAKKYSDDRFKLSDDECMLIDGAFADTLTMLPKALMRKLKKFIPFIPLVLVILPIMSKRIAYVIDKPLQTQQAVEKVETTGVQPNA